MFFRSALGLLICVLIISNAFAAKVITDNNIYLPSETDRLIKFGNLEQLSSKAAWTNFVNNYGDWSVIVNKSTGTPHRAFGKPIKISGYNTLNYSNIEEASMKFIRDYKGILGVNPDNLRLINAKLVNNKWYVSYIQTYNGLDVILSEVELRISNDGRVFAFGSDFFSNINVNLIPAITANKAIESAAKGIEFNKGQDKALSSENLYVLPVVNGKKINFNLVYKVRLITDNNPGNYVTYVDAHDGKVIWRKNQVLNASSEVTVKGGIKLRSPIDTVKIVNLPNMYVKINNQRYTTDSKGTLNAELTDSASVIAALEGPWAKVTISDQNKKSASYSGTIQPGTSFDLIWDDNNSHRFERNLFYYANSVRDYIKSIDTNFDGMDFQLPVRLQFQGQSANAYWDGSSITFLAVGNSEMRMADGPAVIYHEYAHGINQKLYEAQGKENGMINASCNEGMADVHSSMILDEPEMGLGVFAQDNNMYIRTLKNKMIYPDSLAADSHSNGQILGGAFWDLRQLTDLATARRLSHFAKYGTPDDPDDGIAFSEWFLETLIADDDDADLTNGTPHLQQIIKAFNNHNIGTALYMQTSFNHTPLADTQVSDQPYKADFNLKSISFLNSKPDSVTLIYSTDNFKTQNSVNATNISADSYTASIPAQPKGSIVQYYFSAYDPVSETKINLSRRLEFLAPYEFLVGFSRKFFDNFESDNGWKVGSSNDDATRGFWERNKPTAIDFTSLGYDLVIQTGKDHSETGDKCFVTGAGGTLQNYVNYMPNGRTSFQSPVFDLSMYKKPVIRFYQWINSQQVVSVPGIIGKFTVYISADSGITWSTVSERIESTEDWEMSQFLLENYIAPTDKVLIKFEANVPHSGVNPMAMLEALVDDFEILDISDLVSVNDMNDDVSIIIAPNPMDNELNVSVSGTQLQNSKIIDVMGRTVFEFNTGSESNIKWDGRNIFGNRVAPGMYYLLVTYPNNQKAYPVVVK